MTELFMALPVLVVGAGFLAVVMKRLPAEEGRILALSFGAHSVAAFAQVIITRDYFGGGDMFGYWFYGSEAAEFLRSRFTAVAPEYLAMFFRQETSFPVPTIAGGASTQSMFVVALFILFLLNNSIYAATLLIAILACFGKLLAYRALRFWIPAPQRRRAMFAFMLLPSAVFWSSGLLKESVIITALGMLSLATSWFVRGKRLFWSAVLAALSVPFIAMIKGYTLFPFVLAATALWYWHRRSQRGKEMLLRPMYVIIALCVGAGGVILLGRALPEYSVDRLGEEIAEHQEQGLRTAGGSNYQLGEVVEERSLAGQVVLAPLALLTALFRPLLFEVRNAMMLLSALETTVLLWLLLRSMRRDSVKGVFRQALGSPAMVFAFVFVLVLSVAVGLSTTNMGTLSRYRAPMVPFFGFLVLMVSARKAAVRAGEPAQLAQEAA